MKNYRVLFTLEYYVTAENENDAIDLAREEGGGPVWDAIEIEVEED